MAMADANQQMKSQIEALKADNSQLHSRCSNLSTRALAMRKEQIELERRHAARRMSDLNPIIVGGGAGAAPAVVPPADCDFADAQAVRALHFGFNAFAVVERALSAGGSTLLDVQHYDEPVARRGCHPHRMLHPEWEWSGV